MSQPQPLPALQVDIRIKTIKEAPVSIHAEYNEDLVVHATLEGPNVLRQVVWNLSADSVLEAGERVVIQSKQIEFGGSGDTKSNARKVNKLFGQNTFTLTSSSGSVMSGPVVLPKEVSVAKFYEWNYDVVLESPRAMNIREDPKVPVQVP